MSTKQQKRDPKARSPENTAVTLSIRKTLLAQIDARAENLGINRSQYLALLARNDLISRGVIELGRDTLPLAKTEEDAKIS